MSDIISTIAARAGISPELARKGLGVLLTGLKKFAPDLHTKIAPHLPESGEAESAYSPAEAGGASGGLMGGIGGMAGKLLGGDAGNAGELMQMFGKAGFSPDQAQKFAPSALDEMKKRCRQTWWTRYMNVCRD